MRSQVVQPPREAALPAWARLGPTFSCQFAATDAGRRTRWGDGRPIRVVRRSKNDGDKDEGHKPIAGGNDRWSKLVVLASSIAPSTALKCFLRFSRSERVWRLAVGSVVFPVVP